MRMRKAESGKRKAESGRADIHEARPLLTCGVTTGTQYTESPYPPATSLPGPRDLRALRLSASMFYAGLSDEPVPTLQYNVGRGRGMWRVWRDPIRRVKLEIQLRCT